MEGISKVAIKNLQDLCDIFNRINQLEARVEELEQWRDRVRKVATETEEKLKYWGTTVR